MGPCVTSFHLYLKVCIRNVIVCTHTHTHTHTHTTHTQKLPDFEITVDAGKMDRFSEHVTFHNSSDPNKLISRPRVKVEVFYTGVYGGIDKRMIHSTVQDTLDPEHACL